MRRLARLLAVALPLVAAMPALANRDGPPRMRPIDAIIIHSLGGPDCRDGVVFHKQIDGTAREWADFFARLPGVSIHYVVDRAGAVAAGLPESKVASHAIGWNRRSIGIELVNNGDGRDPFTAPQLAALLRLVHDIRARHPAVRPETIRRHSDVDVSTFPVAKHGPGCDRHRRKLDPGDAFPWAAFIEAVRERRAELPAPPR
ncbi:MAG: N-acetylmuramoyl-L-alanine amidase [Alphaproteobacteria bacterium]|nr:N-acetylmuramoyl-L-alanine amidase [Alphaproteobacteria bacterium]